MRTLTVYILASRSRATYVGVTNHVERQLAEHWAGVSDYTSRYRIDRLVHLEEYPSARDAIAREKQIKGWSRAKKTALIEAENPTWRDLEGSRYGASSRAVAPRRTESDLEDGQDSATGRSASRSFGSAQDDAVGETGAMLTWNAGSTSRTTQERSTSARTITPSSKSHPTNNVIPNRQVGAASLSRNLDAQQVDALCQSDIEARDAPFVLEADSGTSATSRTSPRPRADAARRDPSTPLRSALDDAVGETETDRHATSRTAPRRTAPHSHPRGRKRTA
ncbi:GIY-YIG nuclease family protein [Rubrivirga sp.]|uniref:GIY-YIG nuclease family protein n=1 Tax=Rubrivirga sp. TaxID=1885344 RepID=UPI003C76DB97